MVLATVQIEAWVSKRVRAAVKQIGSTNAFGDPCFYLNRRQHHAGLERSSTPNPYTPTTVIVNDLRWSRFVNCWNSGSPRSRLQSSWTWLDDFGLRSCGNTGRLSSNFIFIICSCALAFRCSFIQTSQELRTILTSSF